MLTSASSAAMWAASRGSLEAISSSRARISTWAACVCRIVGSVTCVDCGLLLWAPQMLSVAWHLRHGPGDLVCFLRALAECAAHLAAQEVGGVGALVQDPLNQLRQQPERGLLRHKAACMVWG